MPQASAAQSNEWLDVRLFVFRNRRMTHDRNQVSVLPVLAATYLEERVHRGLDVQSKRWPRDDEGFEVVIGRQAIRQDSFVTACRLFANLLFWLRLR